MNHHCKINVSGFFFYKKKLVNSYKYPTKEIIVSDNEALLYSVFNIYLYILSFTSILL